MRKFVHVDVLGGVIEMGESGDPARPVHLAVLVAEQVKSGVWMTPEQWRDFQDAIWTVSLTVKDKGEGALFTPLLAPPGADLAASSPR